MAQQLYEEGNLIDDGDNVFVVTAVSYQEDNGEKTNLTYHIRLQSEVVAEMADAVSKRQAAKLEANTLPTDDGEDTTDDDGVPRV